MVENEPHEVGERITKRINIFLLGNNEVGKTSFISRYLYDKFEIKYTPTISLNSDFTPKSIIIEDILYLIIFFDPTGKKSSIQHLTQFIKKSDGFIIMYDITNKESFEAIPDWIKIVTDIKGEKIPIIILGNKVEKSSERKISEEDGEKFKSDNIDFLEISVRSRRNIEEAVIKLFNKIVESMPKKQKSVEIPIPEKTIINNDNLREKKSCCF